MTLKIAFDDDDDDEDDDDDDGGGGGGGDGGGGGGGGGGELFAYISIVSFLLKNRCRCHKISYPLAYPKKN